MYGKLILSVKEFVCHNVCLKLTACYFVQPVKNYHKYSDFTNKLFIMTESSQDMCGTAFILFVH